MSKCSQARRQAINPGADVLRRKLRREGAQTAEAAVSPVKAARRAVARAADQAFGLALRVSGIRQTRIDLADVADELSEDWALFPVLHEDGSVGVIALDPATVIAFVEQQTLGRVVNRQGDPRRLTRTDKALAAPFLDGFLAQFDEALEGAPTAYWTCGYRAEDAVRTRHLMVLRLDAGEYRGFSISAECVEGGLACQMQIFLPIKEQATSPEGAAAGKNTDGTAGSGAKLSHAVMPAQIQMNAVICRFSMPLAQLRSLQPGQLISLPHDAGEAARLEDSEGRTSLPIRLGQLHGLRAVRLTEGGRATDRKDEGPKPQTQLHRADGLGRDHSQKDRKSPASLPEAIEERKGEGLATEEQDVPKVSVDELDLLLQSNP